MKTIEEMIAVMTAEKEGKTIQCVGKGCDDWQDTKNPCWDWSTFDYRVKPGKKLRPYANAMEFADAMREHGPMLKNIEAYDTYRMPTNAFSTVVWITGNPDSIKYKDLLMSYKWQDGHKCGIMEGGEV